ncbi:MAG: hypothetical protein EOM23_00585 [Candidatus Moranbacteria bacterium]|nr:hypothetical protein [Candidatus Moranbacteria bacterium]
MNQKKKSALSKVFAIAGTVLLIAPILFLLVISVVGSIADNRILFDYLMLAELFPIVALGLVLLFLASMLSRTLSKWIGWCSAAALILLAGAQMFATASGLATGALSMDSIAFVIVVCAIALYNLLIVTIAVLGILLIKRLFEVEREKPSPDSAQ